MVNCKTIDNSQEKSCHACNGNGSTIKDSIPGVVCGTCKGTGKYYETHYLLVATQPNGQKICFDVDNGGK